MDNEPERIDPVSGKPMIHVPGFSEEDLIWIDRVESGVSTSGQYFLVLHKQCGGELFLAVPSEQFIDVLISRLNNCRKRMYKVDTGTSGSHKL